MAMFFFFVSTSLLLLLVWSPATAKPCEGKELPADAHLRIKPKKHAPEDCTRHAAAGDTVTIHFEGRKYSDCSVFDNTYDDEEPFTFTIGKDAVIVGWEDGVKGMCVGEIRTLTVPANMAYGDLGAGYVIPPKSTLIFDVELLKIRRKKKDADAATKKRARRREKLRENAKQFTGFKAKEDGAL